MGQQSSKESESSVVGSTVRAVSGATGAAAGAVKDTAGQVSQILCICHCKNGWAMYVMLFWIWHLESAFQSFFHGSLRFVM